MQFTQNFKHQMVIILNGQLYILRKILTGNQHASHRYAHQQLTSVSFHPRLNHGKYSQVLQTAVVVSKLIENWLNLMMRWTHSSSERDGDEFEFDRRHIVALCDVWNCRLGQGSSSLYILQYHNGFLTFDNQIADSMVCPMAQCGAQF